MKNNVFINRASVGIIFSVFFVFVFAGNLLGQNEKTYPLYPNGLKENTIKHKQTESYVDSVVSTASLSGKSRVYSFVSEPAYLLFPAKKSENKHIGLVIAPGGGLRNIWIDKEGTDIAMWLSERGITCMVLKYRVNYRDEKGKWDIDFETYKSAAEEDAKQAVIMMRSLADSLDFDSKKIGMVGFSAGGWLTERITVMKMEKYGASRPDWMPDFAGLIYHANAPKYVKNVEEIKKLPPMFMAIARNDEKLPVQELLLYLTTILLNVEKSELHVYNSGHHGFGLADDKGFSIALWKDSFYNWMLDVTAGMK